jgi:hypothetical protein
VRLYVHRQGEKCIKVWTKEDFIYLKQHITSVVGQRLQAIKYNALFLVAILVFSKLLKCVSRWRFMKIGPGYVSRTVNENLLNSTGHSLS